MQYGQISVLMCFVLCGIGWRSRFKANGTKNRRDEIGEFIDKFNKILLNASPSLSEK